MKSKRTNEIKRLTDTGTTDSFFNPIKGKAPELTERGGDQPRDDVEERGRGG